MLEPKVIRLAKLTRVRVGQWTRRDKVRRDLRGACGVASVALWQLLKAHGYEAGLRYWYSPGRAHCWVELNGHVLDITASQFGKDDIFVMPVTAKPLHPEIYMGDKVLRNNKALEEARDLIVSWFDYRSEIKQLLKDATRARYTNTYTR